MCRTTLPAWLVQMLCKVGFCIMTRFGELEWVQSTAPQCCLSVGTQLLYLFVPFQAGVLKPALQGIDMGGAWL